MTRDRQYKRARAGSRISSWRLRSTNHDANQIVYTSSQDNTRRREDKLPTWTYGDEAGDYAVPNVLIPRDLVSRPDYRTKPEHHHHRRISSVARLAWGRGSWSLFLSCICLLAMHTLICVTFSLPPGVGGWLRLLLVALPGLFCLPFFS